jgi:hypothetical protein
MEQPPDPPLETEEEIAGRETGDDDDIRTWFAEIDKRGSRLIGSQVSKPANAATVRVRDRGVIVSDGPFAETKEWMAGFDVIECASMAEAVEIAALHPVAAFGMIEVRPFLPEAWRE